MASKNAVVFGWDWDSGMAQFYLFCSALIALLVAAAPLGVNAPGLAVTLQPRRPGDSWTRMLDGFMSRPGLLSRTTPTNPPAIARLHTWNDADLLLGGPIVTGHAGLVLAADWTRSSRF